MSGLTPRRSGLACAAELDIVILQGMVNKPLVPTRKGEAPVLAAQRRR